uniref:Bromo domain-containing protein n=1 Tax=Coccidioides posadasii RMSCC 3488 TaxID=454284 RepID=A0A0J6F5L3_COCPO|nr:hypothetical protein CPAG_00591 [Coccidioides posadasii RMSCC 3488]
MPPKRRASTAGPQEAPVRFPKRRRYTTYVPETDETPEQTTKGGLELLERIKAAKDKYHNPISPEFLHLPDRNKFPEYFAAIRLPLALDIIEKKLRNHEYPCLTLLEADLRRMVSNAKSYNEKGSTLFSNAERIRKIVVAFMSESNPAYKDEKYVPFSAPVPDDDEDEDDGEGEEEEDVSTEPPPKRSSSRTDQSEATSRRNGQAHTHRTPTTDREVEPSESSNHAFEGDTFDQAQERIISEMIRLKDEDGEEVFFPFLSKPDRTLYKEYYDFIQHPTSLRTILKNVRGTARKKNAHRISPFRTWDAFADEVSYIWRNAREFNEDGSAIVELAGELEQHFLRRLEAARRAVPEPAPASEGGPTRIKLRVGTTKTPEPSSQKLTLKFPGKSAEATGDKQHLGVSVDSESLRRQQELVRAGSGRTETPSQPPTSTRVLRDRAPFAAKSQTPLQQPASGPPTPKPKVEGHPSQSPRGVAPNVAPHNEVNNQSNGLSPALAAATPTPNGPYLRSAGAAAQMNSHKSVTPSQPSAGPATGWPPRRYVVPRSRLITHVNLRTENGPKFNLEIPSSCITPRQSVTLSVPFSHNLLYLRPTVISSNLERQTQLTVTVGSQKIPSIGPPVRSTDFTIPKYELRLGPGVTKVDIEMHAAPGRGLVNLSTPNGPGVEYEAFTLYVHVMHR